MKIYSIDLPEGSTFKNLVTPVGDTTPLNPNVGELFWRTGTGLTVYTGTGWEVLNTKKISYFSAVTDTSSIWTVNYSGFSTVDFVSVTVVRDDAAVTSQSFGSVKSYSTTTATGFVLDSNTLVGSGEGLQFSGAGIMVHVRVEGSSSP